MKYIKNVLQNTTFIVLKKMDPMQPAFFTGTVKEAAAAANLSGLKTSSESTKIKFTPLNKEKQD